MMSGRFFRAVTLLWASVALGDCGFGRCGHSRRTEGVPGLEQARRDGSCDNRDVQTSRPHQLVASRLDDEVKRFDESYRTLLRDNKVDERRVKLSQGLEPDGFMIRFVAEQGDLLALEGRRQHGNVCYLSNVIAAAEMTKLNFGTALYAPLRLNIYENTHGGTTFECDTPSTEFGQFHNADIDRLPRAWMTTCYV
ncbi:MAG: hypothetical protein JWP25_716 [Bradyrhizobium sp.]|nr:hypothetical protein [Bradyrhizobium sp.]